MADDILKDAKEAFALCVAHEAENRATAIDDIRFARLEEQWPAEVRKRRELDGRPCLTFNKLKAFRQQVVNEARQNRPQIKVHPVDDQADPQVAEIYNGLIRNIQVISDADVAFDTALEGAVDGGIGYFRVNTRYADDDSFDLDIAIEAVTNPLSVYGDPMSTAADSAEWNTAFVVDMVEKDRFEKLYRGAEAANWDDTGYGRLEAPWLDGDMVMLAEYWTREPVLRTILLLSSNEIVGADVFEKQQAVFAAAGVTVLASREVGSHKVVQHLMSGAEELDKKDWVGRYIPIIPVYGDVIHLEGKRHLRSFIHSAKDTQRNFNYWRTTSTELVALAPRAPFIGPKGAFKTDADKWDTANTDNHAYIEFDGPTPPQRQPFAGPAAGALQEALNASDDLKAILGMFDASMGAAAESGAEQSGRAIIGLQKRGETSTFHITDNLTRAIRHAGRVIIDLVPNVYTGKRILRVLGPDGVPMLTPVNQQVIPQPQAPGAPPPLPGQPTKYIPAPQPQGQIGAPQQPDQNAQALVKTFDLTVGKYDLVVEAGPSFNTKREEAANQMLAIAQADPQILPLIGDILVKNLDWPGADEIVARIQAARQQEQQGGGPQGKAQAEQQANLARIQAEGQAKSQQMAQEHQQRLQEMGQQHELAQQQQAEQAALEAKKLDGQLALKQRESAANMQLKRQEAEAELELAQWTAEQSMRIKAMEAATRSDETVETPITSIGGGIG